MREQPAITIEHLGAILHRLPFYLVLVDEHDRIAWTSRSSVPADHVIGKNVYEITETASHADLRDGLAAARSGGTGTWVGRSTIPGIGDMTYRCTAHQPTVVIDSVSYVVLVTTNITEQRRTELALEASESRYRALLAAHPDYIATFDSERRFRSVNRIAAGLTADQVIGKRLDDFLDAEAALLAIPIFNRALADGTPGRYPAVARLPEGDRTFDTRVLRVPPENGEPRIMLITTDITEAHAAAESVRQSEARLAQAQRLEIVGQLAGGVAHDFNNMLLVIQAHADLGQRRLHEPALLNDCLAAIRTAVDRASELTSQLLAVARRQSIALTPIELGELVEETIRLLGRTLPETIRIHRRGGSTAWVQGDAGQLSQVLVNLAINARDAMPNGGELCFELQPHPDNDAEIRISVRDSGAGIAPELIDRVFEPFFTTKANGLGSGLGLAVAHGIIRQHGGRIEVDSQLGRGSCFHIDLPTAREVVKPTTVAKRPPSGSGLVVLLAEDEPPVREVVSVMLVEAGYQVLKAETGTAAIAIVRARSDLALAILDAVMPEGTGRDVYDVLIAERPGVPVLFTTGYGAGVLPGDIGSRPGVGLLPKPYAMNELLNEVARLVATRPDQLSAET